MIIKSEIPRPIDRAQVLRAARSIGLLGGSAGNAPRIMAALCEREVQPKDVVSLLKDEPAICARVLRVANSPVYGQLKSVSSIEKAMTVLGLDAVRGIAAAACLDRTMAGGHSAPVDLSSVVRHSQATAAAADSIAHHCSWDLVSEAFIAGLLHNLGVIVQLRVDPEGIAALLDAHRSGDDRAINILESERASIGHEECGAIVFEEWHLPTSLVCVARYHHRPLQAVGSERRLAALIGICSSWAIATGSGFELEAKSARLNPDALECLGLEEAQFKEIAVSVEKRMSELKRALQG